MIFNIYTALFQTYSTESRCVIGPENTLLAGASVSPDILQAGAVKGLIKGSKNSLSLSPSVSYLSDSFSLFICPPNQPHVAVQHVAKNNTEKLNFVCISWS